MRFEVCNEVFELDEHVVKHFLESNRYYSCIDRDVKNTFDAVYKRRLEEGYCVLFENALCVLLCAKFNIQFKMFMFELMWKKNIGKGLDIHENSMILSDFSVLTLNYE